MKTFYDMFETDGKLEAEKGIVLDYEELGQIRIARAGGSNAKYRKTLEARIKPFRHKYDLGMMDPDLDKKIMVETFVDACMIGWDNVKDRAGNVMDYSRANAIKLFTELPDLFQDVYLQATKFTNFQKAQIEEDVKNSEPA